MSLAFQVGGSFGGLRERRNYSLGADGTIYFGSWDQKPFAVKPDGTKKWEFTTGGIVRASAAIDADGTIYFGSEDKKDTPSNRTAPRSGNS